MVRCFASVSTDAFRNMRPGVKGKKKTDARNARRSLRAADVPRSPAAADLVRFSGGPRGFDEGIGKNRRDDVDAERESRRMQPDIVQGLRGRRSTTSRPNHSISSSRLFARGAMLILRKPEC